MDECGHSPLTMLHWIQPRGQMTKRSICSLISRIWRKKTLKKQKRRHFFSSSIRCPAAQRHVWSIALIATRWSPMVNKFHGSILSSISSSLQVHFYSMLQRQYTVDSESIRLCSMQCYTVSNYKVNVYLNSEHGCCLFIKSIHVVTMYWRTRCSSILILYMYE